MTYVGIKTLYHNVNTSSNTNFDFSRLFALFVEKDSILNKKKTSSQMNGNHLQMKTKKSLTHMLQYQ